MSSVFYICTNFFVAFLYLQCHTIITDVTVASPYMATLRTKTNYILTDVNRKYFTAIWRFFMQHQFVLVLDFGGQYNQLIARRVRECGVYCEVHPYNTTIEKIKELNPVGIIFTGGPNSVYEPNAPKCDPAIFELNVPILGICYGIHMMAYFLGGKVKASSNREYGKTETALNISSALFKGFEQNIITWMSHTDYIECLPAGFEITASSASCPVAAMQNVNKGFYGVQFHPEVLHTQNGILILKNFLFDICRCTGDWTMGDYAKTTILNLREKIGDGRVLLALSGGVDSSVAAALLSKAVASKLTCIFVDHGLMRKNEGDEVEAAFADKGMNFIRVNAEERFLNRLSGVTEPEAKRKIIGEEFIRVFEDESKKLGSVDFLVQGTIYPDVIESGAGDAAVIKSHHNVGGLPDLVDFKEIIEPLRLLFKDEVRKLGLELAFPNILYGVSPSPGLGLPFVLSVKSRRKSLKFCGMPIIFSGRRLKNPGLCVIFINTLLCLQTCVL